jgi:iron complex outermembrane receptor protein
LEQRIAQPRDSASNREGMMGWNKDIARRGHPTRYLFGATSALALAIAGFAAPAHAQDVAAMESDDETITITGFRASLNAALADKREANAIVDVIRAEDIADFPDNNLAESIQRIPGVAITRDQGEGRQITVRGLGPTFTRVRINGMEGLSTTGGSDASGGANRGRQFDFNIFASELFNSITVRKTATADVEEGSLGATVDLQTARPFDYRDDFVLVGTGQLGVNDLSGSVDPRIAGLVSWRGADGRVGILVSASYSEREIVEEGPSTVRWAQGTADGGFNAASVLPSGATNFGFFHPRIPRYDSYLYNTQRLGLTGSFQFQPTDATLISLDALYARFRSERAEQYLEAISFSRNAAAGGKPQTILRPGGVVEGNSLVFGVFDNVDVRVESRFDELTTTFQQYTAALTHDFSNRLSVSLLGGYSESKFRNPIQTTVALDVLNIQNYVYDFRSGRLPFFSYGNLDVADPNAYTLGEIRLRPQFVDNDFTVARGELSYEFSPQFTLRGGVDYKRYGFDSRELRRASETVVPTLAPGQLASLSTIWLINSGTPLPNGTPRAFVVPDLEAFANALGIYSNTGIFQLFGIENATARANFRTVNERALGFYGQIDYNIPVGGIELRGNIGGRYVRTRQTSTGYTGQGATLELIEVRRTYDDFLPSFNVAAELGGGFILRGASARVLARPDIGTINPGGAFSVSGGNRTFNRGNPFIDPTQATTFDISAEWYFAPESALIVGLFYKDIGTFVANTTQQIPFNQLGLPESLLVGTPATPTDVFTVNQPVNSEGGTLKGIEVGLQMPFRFLPGFWRNMGIQANYTYVDSEIDYPLTTAPNSPVVTQPLVNLSRNMANLTIYYEDSRFRARGSVAYRSGYLQQVPGRNGVAATNPNAAQPGFNDVEGVNSSLNFDVSASYALTPNISLTFEGVNLTDEYVDQYIDSADNRLSTYHHTGRQFYFGVRVTY